MQTGPKAAAAMIDSLAISPGARDALAGWLDHVRALDGAAENTVEAYRADVAGFLAFMAVHTGGHQGRAALARVGFPGCGRGWRMSAAGALAHARLPGRFRQ